MVQGGCDQPPGLGRLPCSDYRVDRAGDDGRIERLFRVVTTLRNDNEERGMIPTGRKEKQPAEWGAFDDRDIVGSLDPKSCAGNDPIAENQACGLHSVEWVRETDV